MTDAIAQPRQTPERKRQRRTIREHGPNPTDLHVGKKLRQARLLGGMSQEQLGAGIGVSFQAVQKYELGENRLSASRLFRAARLLGCQIGFFFAELGTPSPADANLALSPEELAMLRDFRRVVGDALRDNLLQMAKRLARTTPGAARTD